MKSKVLAAALMMSTCTQAAELQFSGDWISYEYDSDSQKESGDQLVVGFEALFEDQVGNFHQLKLQKDLWDDSEYSGEILGGSRGKAGSDSSYFAAEYRFGRFYYPEAESSDISIWTGLGVREHEYKGAGSSAYKQIRSRTYIPFGTEYGFALNGDGFQSRSTDFMFMGAEYQHLVDGTHTKKLGNADSSYPTVHLDQENGYGLSVWLGYDLVLDKDTRFRTKLSYEKWEVGSSETEQFTNAGTTYSYKESESTESLWRITAGYIF